MPSNTPPRLRTAPVLAVLVCHDGDRWLHTALSALRRQRVRPRHVIAVDTGSTDRTPKLLADAAAGPNRVLDGVLTLPRGTGFGAAVRAGVDHAVQRWGDPGRWLWLLHDDCAPEPDCLAALLTVAEVSPSAALLGPLCLDWADPRLVVEVGLSTDASGHRQTGIAGDLAPVSNPDTNPDTGPHTGPDADPDGEPPRLGTDQRFEQSTEVLAVSSAGSLIRRQVWHDLGGYDPALPMIRDDLDFGWRVNRAGHVVLCAPVARMRHARAASRGDRRLDAAVARPGPFLRAVDRAHGLRTFLVNCAPLSFLLGLPRLTALTLLRALGFLLLRRVSDARAELAALRYLLTGRAGLLAARAQRRATAAPGQRSVRGLFTSRVTRIRNLVRGGATYLIRQRVRADVALGRLPAGETTASWLPPEAENAGARPLTGPDALPAGALRRLGPIRRTAGLRRPPSAVVVPVTTDAALAPFLRPSPRPRPSPVPRGTPATATPDLVFVTVDRGRVLRQLLLAPPLLMVLALTLFALAANWTRLGADLAGGRLLPVGDLAATWREYLAAWHPVGGGTAAPAPAALAVLGILGVPLAPFGGPAAAVAVLLLGDAPLAALAGYLASRRMRVRRSVRAVVAAGYGLLPAATSAVTQGRLDVVVVHLLAPLLFAGVAAVLRPPAIDALGRRSSWLSVAMGTAFGVAVVGAFSPLTHLLVLAAALVGFVVVPARRGDGRRRVAALFAVVLLPLALLLPWPAVLLQHPSVVLHGVGGTLSAQPADTADLLALWPGGPGAVPVVGVLIPLAVLAALILRPGRAMLPGLAVALLGAAGTALVLAAPATPLGAQQPERGWTGAPLVLIGWGLLWAVLGACQREAGPVLRFGIRRRHARLVAVVLGLTTGAALATAAAFTLSGGELRTGGGPTLATPLLRELDRTHRSVLVLAHAGAPTRQTAGRLPAFGDDDLAATPGSTERLARWTADLTGDQAERARDALARAAADGVVFLVLPDQAAADRLRTLAGQLVGGEPATSDGRPVLRIQLPSGTAVLLSPELAQRARAGSQPPAELATRGIAPVDAYPPDLAARVSDGPEGRLLVLAAADEPGWQATVDGRPVPILRSWDHQVGVPLPTTAANVVVDLPSALRDLLLLAQTAIALFTLLTAIPSRR